MDQIGLGSLMLGTTIDGAILLHGVMPTNYDLADRAINGGEPSLIRWETTGDPGSRVFAIEWANAGLYDEVFGAEGASLSYVNLQVRLFEADNVIEFHYGPSDIASEITDFEPQISGLLLEVDVFSEYYDGSIYAIEGNPTDPTLTPLDGLDAWYYGPALTSYPTDGTVYRFAFNAVVAFSKWRNITPFWCTSLFYYYQNSTYEKSAPVIFIERGNIDIFQVKCAMEVPPLLFQNFGFRT